MSPITAQQAWDATDPSQTDEERQRAAENIMAGVAANDAYLSSRGELEQLIARAKGDQIVSHADINSGEATAGDVGSGDTAGALPTESGPPTVDSTVVPGSETESPATESPATPVAGVTSDGGTNANSESSQTTAKSDSNSGSASEADELRAQLLKYGITPDA